eukprot:gnl/MRDRNA2_/MRDRNA2_78556_c0_seq2.p1 gnl/MRDRNA2_/MRDRNA2_78556_c0~~gnl/MRDRNA2_/MRDRNA2_78556_c0_seq2.p1  ORF type:complete len:641 (+),score=106.31 gnl/MRDRNA2_/MRDRNA2_78556_c0_seq2:65-1924(+)
MTIYYDPQKPILRHVLSWSGTVFPQVFKMVTYWILLLLQIYTTYLFRQYHLSKEADDRQERDLFHIPAPANDDILKHFVVPWPIMVVGTTLMTFLLVFYNSQCYERYKALYGLCMGMDEAAKMFMREVVVRLKGKDLAPYRLKALKYLVASTHIFYFNLTGGGIAEEEWEYLEKKGLLISVEAELLRKYGGDQCMALNMWIMTLMDEILFGEASKIFMADVAMPVRNATYGRVDSCMKTFLQRQRKVIDMLALPVPFAYFHMVNMVLLCNCMLIGLAMANYGTYTTCVVYACILVAFLGLRQVSTALADPFGTDDVDFPLIHFLNQHYTHVVWQFGAVDLFAPHMKSLVQEEACKWFTSEELQMNMKKECVYPDHGECLFQWGVPGKEWSAMFGSMEETPPTPQIAYEKFDPVKAGKSVKRRSTTSEFERSGNSGNTTDGLLRPDNCVGTAAVRSKVESPVVAAAPPDAGNAVCPTPSKTGFQTAQNFINEAVISRTPRALLPCCSPRPAAPPNQGVEVSQISGSQVHSLVHPVDAIWPKDEQSEEVVSGDRAKPEIAEEFHSSMASSTSWASPASPVMRPERFDCHTERARPKSFERPPQERMSQSSTFPGVFVLLQF